MNDKPVVAIVGRPNVGKSMLFNKLCGRRLSIVEDTPGVTRDRLYAGCHWNGRDFMMVDTGGVESRADTEMLRFMREQVDIAIAHADVIILLTDLRTGVTAADEALTVRLRQTKKPVVLAVNKADSVGANDPALYEFYALGLGEPHPVSALHGLGTGDLLDACLAHFPLQTDTPEDGGVISVAVIGRPNVGKSSLVNRVLGANRVIVSDVPGTTRDAVDEYVENETGRYLFIDTAGLRRRARVHDAIEHYANLRAQMAIERAAVCLLLLDATQGVTEQDTKVAGLAHEAGRATVLVVNKWDLIEKETGTMARYTKDIRRDLAYMTYAPIHFVSAMTGQRVPKLFDLIRYVSDQNRRRVPTGQLNEVLADAVARVQPPSDKGRRLKVLYMTQVDVAPPHFVVFVNDARLMHFSYRRYLENQIRETFGLDGTPIRMSIRERSGREDME